MADIMVKDNIQQQREFVLEQLDQCDLDSAKKMVYTNLLNHAAIGTNGLSPEDKLQNTTESLFQLVCLNLLKVVREHNEKKQPVKTKNEKIIDMVIACRWPITIALCVISFLLSQQGQLSQVIDKLL